MPTPDQVGRQLHEVLAPIVAGAGLELDELDVRATGRRHTVKVVVDSADDTAGVSLDVIAKLSRAASAELDQHEHLIGGSYTLEVTSPGIDRPLTLPRHWRKAYLRLVEVTLADGGKLTGRVGDAGEDEVALLVDGSVRSLAYADVAKALVQVEFKQAPAAEVEKLGGRVERTEDEV
ncbi:MAG: ribosome maturation factor RimP [Pseudonocardiaceae bacterium]|nr:MAG: ribosome maturation factor RimP [Pseudonocardiaceae bacterium]